MSPKINILKNKFAAILQAISESIDTKLDGNAPAVSADKLTTPFQLTATNDVLGTTSIQGDSDVNWSISLSLTGVAAGVYPKVTVDAKGRVTGGQLLLAADIPNLDAAKIATGAFDAARIPNLDASKVASGVFAASRIPLLNQNTTGNAATANKLASAFGLQLSGDVLVNGMLDGGSSVNFNAVLAASGVTAGVYGSETAIPQVTVDAKGRVTSISIVSIKPSTAIPVKEYVDIAAGVTQSYDLVTLLGAAATDFDLSSAEIVVSVKDTNPVSPTYNAYINPEAVATYGLLDERYVLIANQFDTSMNFHVKVLVHPNVI